MSAAPPLSLARRFAGAIEPLTGQVYFAPECHTAYEALGFGPPLLAPTGLALPNGPAYFTSRGSVMGQVRGDVVTAAFGVFNPEVVIPGVTFGWTLIDADTICAARDAGALGQLHRALGEPASLARAGELLDRMVAPLTPEGRPLFAGLHGLAVPDDAFGKLWRQGDRLREYRGDSHIAAWVSAGLDPIEIGLLTEPYWGLPVKTYVRSRGWSEQQLDDGIDRLRTRGFLDAENVLTPVGRAFREAIEVTTDASMAAAMAALGDDADELLALLAPWGIAVRAANGYPSSGPKDVADATKG